ncbi:hypothetical protein M427DRAFT_376257 [Gonapodya prolifera JEL478]|uniref:NAD-capped RNA hydrolase NUDT12 n=1 Tax=Gonapodya prolifera (strain JEL478) TaxID=1344416 RepID=A0A139AV69_GONPJ|nr:hypothetical protein M427DRAFT_376257 [Gonapodya prolifera JEL478]|eukprot:KXS20473.1 hypothetical protein M427DRAFT_376257 [Gonapodya prolifera JEL478]
MAASQAQQRQLFQACADGNVDAVRKFLPQMVNQANDRGWTPLHFAARFGHVAVAKELLAAGAKPTSADKDGRTPLELASFWGHSQIVELFSAAGAPSKSPLSPPTPKKSTTGRVTLGLSSPAQKSSISTTASVKNLETTTKAVDDAAGVLEGTVSSELRSTMKEFTNFFAGNKLKRLSEKRTDSTFISSLLSRDTTRYIIFNGQQALFHSPVSSSSSSQRSLQFLSYTDVASYIDLSGRSKRQWVFLGVDEDDVVDQAAGRGRGRAYVALDLTTGTGDDIGGEAALFKAQTSQGGKLESIRPAAFRLPPDQAAFLGEGSSMIDWNIRRKHCAGCGRKTYSEEAGFKRACGPMPAGQKPCITSKGLNNFQHPRTDPVVIVAIISKDGKRVFLGRNKNFPPKFFSCIAGFMEPGESIEECVRREVREETGIRVSNIVIHSSQPWPFPSQLMIGCVAVAETEKFEPEEEELTEAKWFDRPSVMAALKLSTRNDFRSSGAPPKVDFALPPSYAIAHVLLRAWALGEVDVGLGLPRAAKL